MLRLAWTALKRRRSSSPKTNLRLVVSPESNPKRMESPSIDSPKQKRRHPVVSDGRSNRCHPNPTATLNHRGRILAMRIAHSRLCSVQRCKRLEALGVLTLGDLAYGDLDTIASNFKAPTKALKQLQRYRRAVRLASSVPSLIPADALALISIHRPHPKSIAAQTPAMLRQDLMRFADSTRGQSLLRGRPVPSIRRIKRWIAGAGEVVAA